MLKNNTDEMLLKSKVYILVYSINISITNNNLNPLDQ